MVRCLVVDDEPNAHLVLKNYLEKTAGFVLEAQCYRVADAFKLLEEHRIDLIFLDLQMPDLTGVDFLNQVDHPAGIILTTAHAEFAVQSYEFAVLDYLLKPFSYQRFTKSLARYTKPVTTQAAALPAKIAMKVDGSTVSFLLADIMYIQSWGNYIKLFTETDSFICTSTTAEVERKLPRERFIRIHKSYVVNIACIVLFDNDYVVLKNQSYIPVGITYRRILANIL